MSPETRYKIEEIERLTGLSRRLIYDYISRELVPPALGSGKGAYYLDEHYDRLRLISLLRRMGFRLERIEEALDKWESAEITRIVEFAEGRDLQSLDTLNEWLTVPMASEVLPIDDAMERDVPAFTATPPSRSAEKLDRLRRSALRLADEHLSNDARRSIARSAQAPRATPAEEQRVAIDAPASSPARSSPTSPETWARARIGPDIEISYRSDIDPERHRIVTELIERARKLLRR